jgi:hypothetical protein
MIAFAHRAAAAAHAEPVKGAPAAAGAV